VWTNFILVENQGKTQALNFYLTVVIRDFVSNPKILLWDNFFSCWIVKWNPRNSIGYHGIAFEANQEP
jgi:hypothetical protein